MASFIALGAAGQATLAGATPVAHHDVYRNFDGAHVVCDVMRAGTQRFAVFAFPAGDPGLVGSGPGDFEGSVEINGTWTTDLTIPGPIRLVFGVPDGWNDSGDIADLLNWSGFVPALTPRALSAAGWNSTSGTAPSAHGDFADPQPPDGGTSILVDCGLLMSPTEQGSWWHRPAPVQRNGRVEMWHTQLLAGEDDRLAMRGVGVWSLQWSDNLKFALNDGEQPGPHDYPHQLVTLTSDFSESVPPTLDLDELVLTPAGPTYSFGGHVADPPAGTAGLSAIRHEAHLGEVERTQVVATGFLFPFPFPVSTGTTYQREWDGEGMTGFSGGTALTFPGVTDLAVLSRVVTLTPSPRQPFRRLELRSRTHLTLQELKSLGTGCKVFAVDTGGGPTTVCTVIVRGTDVDGNTVDMVVPLIVVDSQATGTVQAYNASAAAQSDAWARIDLHGQRLALAPSVDGRGAFPVDHLNLAGTANGAQAPTFEVTVAAIRHPAAAAFTGTPGPIAVVPTAGWTPPAAGEPDAPFARLADGHSLAVETSEASGLRSARGIGELSGLPLSDLSLVNGLVPTGGTYHPQPGTSGLTLLGVFELGEALAGIAPVVVSSLAGGVRTTSLTVRSDNDINVAHGPISLQGSGLQVRAIVKAPAGAAPSGTAGRSLTATMAASTLILTGPGGNGVELPLTDLTWSAPAGAKPSLSVDVGLPNFVGDLSFLDPILQSLPQDLLSNPPVLDVDDSRAKLGYDLPVPEIGFGIFALSDIDLSAVMTLPFDGGGPAFEFDFASQHAPFHASVDGFTGGGFCDITISQLGIGVDAGISFGGSFSFDVAIVSGGISLIASVYMSVQPQTTSIGGSVELSGSLSLIDIASVSIDVYLGVTYASHVWHAEGDVNARVDVLFLHKTFTFHVAHDFGGDGGSAVADRSVSPASRSPQILPAPQPIGSSAGAIRRRSFAQAVDEPAWRAYCAGFAPAG